MHGCGGAPRRGQSDLFFSDTDADGDLDMCFELGGFYHGDFSHSAFYINDLGDRNNWLAGAPANERIRVVKGRPEWSLE